MFVIKVERPLTTTFAAENIQQKKDISIKHGTRISFRHCCRIYDICPSKGEEVY